MIDSAKFQFESFVYWFLMYKKEIRETLLHGLIMNVGDLKIIETIVRKNNI